MISNSTEIKRKHETSLACWNVMLSKDEHWIVLCTEITQNWKESEKRKDDKISVQHTKYIILAPRNFPANSIINIRVTGYFLKSRASHTKLTLLLTYVKNHFRSEFGNAFSPTLPLPRPPSLSVTFLFLSHWLDVHFLLNLVCSARNIWRHTVTRTHTHAHIKCVSTKTAFVQITCDIIHTDLL